MHLEQDFVRHWSDRYVDEELEESALEYELLSTTHAAIASRGYATSKELVKIVTWKSQRALGHLERDDETVKDVTRTAFARDTPDWMRHHILCILSGVRHPVASAILTVRYPETHTVVDDRAVGAVQKLWRLGLLDVEPPSDTNHYWAYLDEVFRPIAASLGVCHRDLDRALWKWHKEGMPESWLVADRDRGIGNMANTPASVAG